MLLFSNVCSLCAHKFMLALGGLDEVNDATETDELSVCCADIYLSKPAEQGHLLMKIARSHPWNLASERL
jgi:hypothetical protein